MAMEMTAVCLGKLAKTASFPHSHSLGDDLEFLFSPSSFNFNSTKSVTHMPGTFCYRHARSLNKAKSLLPTLIWRSFSERRPRSATLRTNT